MNRAWSLATICLIKAFVTPEALAQALYDFNLPQQALADSLRAIGRQTAMSILSSLRRLRTSLHRPCTDNYRQVTPSSACSREPS